MKKLFVALAVLVVVLAGCPTDEGKGDGNGNGGDTASTLRIKNESSVTIKDVIWNNVSFAGIENADIIGTWTGLTTGSFVGSDISLIIGKNTWTVAFTNSIFGESDGGTWTRNENTINFRSSSTMPPGYNGTGILSGEILTLNIQTHARPNPGVIELTSNNLDNSIKPGNNGTRTVKEGSGYIRFSVNSIAYRSEELVVVEKKDNAEFTFTNNTVVRDNNSNNPVTLGGL